MKIRKLIAGMLCALILLGMAGCGVAVDKAAGSGTSNDYIAKEEGTLDAESSAALPENRKLIQTVNMNVETENLDTVLQQIDSRIAQLGGYVEKSNVQNGSAYSGRRYRSANITVRIPAKDLESFIDRVGEISNIVSSRKTVEDVTLGYVATESRMKALQAEEARLLELMAKAGTLDELLTVEKRLTEVRTELEKVTSALRVFDNQVDFATVHLSIEEVKEFTEVTEPENIWERIGTGFKKSLKSVGNFFVELFVFVIVSLPYIAMIAVIPLGIVLIIRLKNRKKKKKPEKEDPKENS
ncbi:MAG: DUF4349 domain-containing protein [Oscillospiraceae bacterium]|nr:DUF4349 domain-containing protein [Oscillospiraceae bacterium]